MTEYWRFFRTRWPLLSYGISFSFLSSFGQTFLVSLFLPFFLADFGLTEGQFGSLYSAATLGSAVLLPWIGGRVDRVPLHRFTLGVVALMAASAVLVSVSEGIVLLAISLVGLRLAGQGLAGHTAATTMARYFEHARGKALSISSVGFPLGEAVLPLVLTGALAVLGWRLSWAAIGVLCAVGFAPLLLLTLRRSGVELDPRAYVPAYGRSAADEGTSKGGADDPYGAPSVDVDPWGRRDVLRDPRFWSVLPAAVLPPFWTTGLILYQTSIAQSKGWSIALMASAFIPFAIARVVSALAIGTWVDRLSARHLFPFAAVPMGGGVVFLLLFEGGWAAHVYMSLLGVTNGMSANVKTALWAELYGTRYLGAIKSMMTSVMVVSTAASPVLVGFALETDQGLVPVLWGAVGSVAVGTLLALRILPRKGGARSVRRSGRG